MKYLETQTTPFQRIYQAICHKNKFLMEDDDIGILVPIPEKISFYYTDMLGFLQEKEKDCIYIETLSQDATLVRGLLCTNVDRNLADTESIFFVGEIFSQSSTICVLSGEELREYCGIEHPFILSSVKLIEQSLAEEERNIAFQKVLKEIITK